MSQAHQAPLPSCLILRILLPNLLNSGDLVSWFSFHHILRPPNIMSLLISTVPGSLREKFLPGVSVSVPVASPPAPALSTPLCVTAFQPLIKCLLYRAGAWSVCQGSGRLVGGTLALTALGFSELGQLSPEEGEAGSPVCWPFSLPEFHCAGGSGFF